MNKKYELTEETKTFKGKILYRIRALKDFSDVRKGDLGGWVEGEHNLSQEGDCWIYDNGCVTSRATIKDNGKVKDSSGVLDYGCVECAGVVSCRSLVCGKGRVTGGGEVSGTRILGGSDVCFKRLFYGVTGFSKVNYTSILYKDCFLDPLNPSEEELIMFELEYGEPFPLELVKSILKV